MNTTTVNPAADINDDAAALSRIADCRLAAHAAFVRYCAEGNSDDLATALELADDAFAIEEQLRISDDEKLTRAILATDDEQRLADLIARIDPADPAVITDYDQRATAGRDGNGWTKLLERVTGLAARITASVSQQPDETLEPIAADEVAALHAHASAAYQQRAAQQQERTAAERSTHAAETPESVKSA